MDKTSVVTVKIQNNMNQSLNNASKVRRVTKSHIIKEAISSWLKENQPQNTFSDWVIEQNKDIKGHDKKTPNDLVENMNNYLYGTKHK